MRRPSAYLQSRGQWDAAMTPMIDVVFLLLVFFLWTASFQIVEHVLPGNLSPQAHAAPQDPAEAPPPEADFDEIVVQILWRDNQPAWLLNEVPVESLAALAQRLAQIARIKQDAPVIVHPEREAPMGAVIDVYDAARLAGFEQVQFAASQGGPWP